MPDDGDPFWLVTPGIGTRSKLPSTEAKERATPTRPPTYPRGKNASMRPRPYWLFNRGRGMKPCTPKRNSPVPAVVSIDDIEPTTLLNVAETGSRTTAMPFTLSIGKSIGVVPDTGSVTSKPSTHKLDSWGRVPPMRSKPSRPRTTAGRSGNDCKMRGRAAGRRCASGAGMVLPMRSIDEPEEPSADATTSVTSVVRARSRVRRAACARGTCSGSKPSRAASTVSSGAPGFNSNAPCASDTTVSITRVSRFTSMRTPGSGSPVWSTTTPRSGSVAAGGGTCACAATGHASATSAIAHTIAQRRRARAALLLPIVPVMPRPPARAPVRARTSVTQAVAGRH